jgi:antitoxin HigA-1
MAKNGMRPVPPGEILKEDFLTPYGLTASALARAIGVPVNRITAILKAQRGVTGDTALRLASFFGTTADLWLNLQKTYELRLAEKAIGPQALRTIEKRRADLIVR